LQELPEIGIYLLGLSRFSSPLEFADGFLLDLS